jgi:hypothetical protein
MVDTSTLTKPRQLAIFAILLIGTAIAIAILARLRIGLVVLRSGFATFNVLSFFYCLSLVGQKAWEASARIAIVLRLASKEPSNVECD